MSLPMWVDEAIEVMGRNKWTDAIRIAWEVLEHHRHIKYQCPYCHAMRKIEGLGE